MTGTWIVIVAFAALQGCYGFPRIRREEITPQAEITLPTVPNQNDEYFGSKITLPTVAPETQPKDEDNWEEFNFVRKGNSDESGENQPNKIHLSEQEIRKDLELMEKAIAREEEKVGHPLNNADWRHVEERLEKKPWYQRFASWASSSFQSTWKSVSNFFGKREVPQRNVRYPDMYHYNTN